jgi:hypothetical protein
MNLSKNDDIRVDLRASDPELVRVIEDVHFTLDKFQDLLISKGIIEEKEKIHLPLKALDKINYRESLRANLNID